MRKRTGRFSAFLLLVIIAVFTLTGCGQQPVEPQPAAPEVTPVPETIPEPEPAASPVVSPEPAPPTPETPPPPPAGPPDLQVKLSSLWNERAIIDTATVVLGDEAESPDNALYFGACIANTGDTEANNVIVKLDSFNVPCYEWLLPEIAAGEEVTISVPLADIVKNLYLNNKDYHIRLRVDPDKTIKETDGSNNIYTGFVKPPYFPEPPEVILVSPENGEQLATTSPRLEWEKPDVYATYRITITEVNEVTKNGVKTYAPVYTTIRDKEVKDTFYDVSPGKLHPGSTYSWQVRSCSGGEYSEYSKPFIFHATDGIDLTPRRLTSWGFSALTIDDAETVQGEYAYPGDDDMYLGVSIANLGNKPAHGVVVAIFWEGHEIFRGYIDTLESNTDTRAWRSWTEIKKAFVMDSGTQNFEMQIDPDNLVKESREYNNIYQTPLEVP